MGALVEVEESLATENSKKYSIPMRCRASASPAPSHAKMKPRPLTSELGLLGLYGPKGKKTAPVSVYSVELNA